MHAPRIVRSALAAAIAASLGGLATACTNQVAGLDGTIAKGTWAGVATTPGRPADYTAWLANHTGHVVVLRSARLMPLKGFDPPHLVHEAIEIGRDTVSSALGWPPAGPQLRNFAGYRLLPGREAKILYSVVAYRLGEYGDAGISVTLLVDGSPAAVDVISVAGTCLVKAIRHDCPDSFYNRLQNAPSP